MKLLLSVLLFFIPFWALAEQKHPNIIWIVSDDLGLELGCYGYPDVETPNLDRLAEEGVRFTQAFSSSPVCSASRTAFITGHYQTSIGGHHHVTRIPPTLADDTPPLTEVLRKAGYFITNGKGVEAPKNELAKTHFNFAYDKKTFFDGSDWSQRKGGQPFFAQVQFSHPHRKFVQSSKSYPNAPIPPYYPEHPVTTADWANYLASIEVLDQRVGKLLDRLKKEGLEDNTIVFFFGDHGRPHVRGKQWLYDSGLHVPLIVRWPANVSSGKKDERLVSLLDLVPTCLKAVGLPVSDKLPGGDLLDKDWTGHPYLIAARDRCGDARDRIRSVRTREFKYIRNFHPEIPYMQHSGYKKGAYPVFTLMKLLHARGEWTSPFMAKTKPAEELYDLSKDPYEINNLAANPAYEETVSSLSKTLDLWITETADQGAIDESETVDMKELMKGKRQYYSTIMERLELSADASDEEILESWEKRLRVK